MNALGRLGRRRRDSHNESLSLLPFPPFTVDASECIRDGAFALLRVSGTGVQLPVALVVDGQSFDPLPSPDPIAGDGSWRIAFALPAELTDGGQVLWLHDGGDFRTKLSLSADSVQPPAPVAPAEPATEVEDEPLHDPRARKLVEAWSEAGQLRDKLAEREEELSDALKDLLIARKLVKPLEDAADSAAEQLAAVREEAELVHAAAKEDRLRLTEKAAELDAVRAELNAALEATANAESATGLAQDEAVRLREMAARLERELGEARAALAEKLAGAHGELETAHAAQAEAMERAGEAEAAAERAASEAAGLRQQVAALQQELADSKAAHEQELTDTKAALEQELTDTKAALEQELASTKAALEEELSGAKAVLGRMESDAAKREKAAAKLQSELEKLQDPSKQRRLGISRRSDDRAVAKVREELEAGVAESQQRIEEQQQRIGELEREAASFAERRDDAVADSLRENVKKLQDELRQQETCSDDLRALLDSEREQGARMRSEVQALKGQLAIATSRKAPEVEESPAKTDGDAKPAEPATTEAREPLPWSGVDDALLARIEKAKALTS